MADLPEDNPPAVAVGAVGWSHEGWAGSYYPQDLPLDWRLTYYANEYGAVLVPAGEWVGAGAARWEQWAEDVPRRFRFFLELPRPDGGLGPALEALEQCAAALGERLGAVLAPDPVNDSAAERLADAAAVRPVLMRFSAPGELAAPLRRLAERGGVGRWGLPAAADQGADLDAALLAPEMLDDLRMTRALIQAQAEGAGEGTRAVFLTGDPPDPARLERLLTLANLLGLA